MAKVLLVEDNASARRLVEFTLQQEGHVVVTANNGKEGLEKAQVEQPDVIVMDIMMPQMGGYEACLRLREIPTTAHIPIMILSAKSQQLDKSFGMMAGADDYLEKPVDPQVIAEHVKKLVARGASEN